MGKGSRPDKAKELVLVSGAAHQVLTPVGPGGAAPTIVPPPDGGAEVTEVVTTAVGPAGSVAGTPAPVGSGGVAADEPETDGRDGDAEPGYPTHLEAGYVSDPTTPEEMLANLNHLVLEGAVSETEFQQLYLHHFEPLGATPGAAHQQWEALKTRQEADRQAARALAEQMQAAIADVRPWNPLDDPARAKADVARMQKAFNAAVVQARQEGAKRGWAVPGHLKDRIAKELAQRTGLGYDRANSFVSAWAGTANDHSTDSVALQVAAAEKFGLELTGWMAKTAGELGAQPDFGETKEKARRFVDAMYEHTQDWLSSRGIKEVVLFRGMHTSIGADTAPVDAAAGPIPASVHLNPLNSWTASYHTSQMAAFAGAGPKGYVLTARVPAHKVIGCCFTGVGCLQEQEFVIAGGQGQKVMAAAKHKVSYGHASGTRWEG
jgi:hypothetical protein